MFSVVERFGVIVGAKPEAPAVVTSTGSVTYSELEALICTLERGLADIGPGSIVALLLADSINSIAATIAVMRRGAIFAPLDPTSPPRRLSELLRTLSPACVMMDGSGHPEIAGGLGPGEAVEATVGVSVKAPQVRLFLSASAQPLAGPEYERTGANSPAYIYFTSGSTGIPKAIVGRRGGIDHFISWEIDTLDVQGSARVSHLTSVAFDASLRDIFTPLCAGGAIIVPPARTTVSNAGDLAHWLEDQRITLLHCVPSVFSNLLTEPLFSGAFPDLRHIVMAGEPLLPRDVGKWFGLFGERVQLFNLYGPSETTMTKLFHPVRPADGGRRSVPIGRPQPGVRAIIVDGKGNPVPRGDIGEILIRTRFASLGYLRQPELTAESFKPNPVSEDRNDLIYATGDFGRVLEDDSFEFLGRRDHQIKLRGVRIELAEVEHAFRENPAVREVVATLQEGLLGTPVLCVFLVLDKDHTSDQALRHVADLLPSSAVPSFALALDKLPRTISGKVDRRNLPSVAALQAAGDRVGPANELQELVHGIWQDILETGQRIGANDSFFALGGHSLLATRVLARLYDATGIEVPLRSLLEEPTIAGLARRLVEAHDQVDNRPRLVRQAQANCGVLSFAQQRLWLVEQMRPGSPDNLMTHAVQIEGTLDTRVLEDALQSLCDRHDLLRATISSEAGNPRQVIHGRLPVPLDRRNTYGLDDREWSSALAETAMEEAHKPFSLDKPPLWRALLMRRSADEHALILTIHHIIADDWSLEIIMRELAAVYQAALDHSSARLAPLPVSYEDFATWQRAGLSSDSIEAEMAYWSAHLDGAKPLLELVPRESRPPSQTFAGRHLRFALAAERFAQLRKLAREQGATMFMLLLAAFDILLARLSGSADILVGTPMANRTRTELEGVVGFFADLVVLRNEVTGAQTYLELLQDVRRETLSAYQHSVLPFDRIVEAAGVRRRDKSYNPVFQVLFGYREAAAAAQEAGALRLLTVPVESGVCRFDLSLNLVGTGDQLSGRIEYNVDLFSADRIARIATMYERILDAVVTDPSVPIGQFLIHPVDSAGVRFAAPILAESTVAPDRLLRPPGTGPNEAVTAREV